MKTDEPSYVLRISKANGRTIWRTERPTNAQYESPDSYTTPALLRYGKNVGSSLPGRCRHRPDWSTGKELWRADGLNPSNDGAYRIVASPVVHGDLIIAPSRERPMLVLKSGGRGDVTSSHLLWSFNNGPDVPTPVTDGTYVYVVNDRGIMWCLDARLERKFMADSGCGQARIAGHSFSPTESSTLRMKMGSPPSSGRARNLRYSRKTALTITR